MSKVIKLRKGLDINLIGSAERVIAKAAEATSYALVPSDYIGITPKLLVKADDPVKAGSPIFFDKENPEVLFTSPISGKVSEIVRGEKRKILAITITPDGKMGSEKFATAGKGTTAEAAKELLLKSGLWTTLIQRPFGIIANSKVTPRDIFITGTDTAPLAADLNFIMQDQKANIEAGISLLSTLTSGKVHLTVGPNDTQLSKIANAELHTIHGKHPAGNVGVQIAHIKPIAKGETVWSVNIQHVAMIGRLALTGSVDMSKIIAVAGSEINKPQYLKIISGASIASIVKGNIKTGSKARLISGNPLSGTKVAADGYLGFYHNQLSAIPEGDTFEAFGWAMPRFGKLSYSRSYFSWLTPGKKYNLDTNTNGGERAFVMNGIYEEVLPMDIYPVYLLKAVMAGDIDKMEALGIYEVVEEDLALCEFICPSKIEWQSTLRQGINLMIKEL